MLSTVLHSNNFYAKCDTQLTLKNELFGQASSVFYIVHSEVHGVVPESQTLYHTKIKPSGFLKTRIPYYQNTDATFQLQLLISGDGKPEPWPLQPYHIIVWQLEHRPSDYLSQQTPWIQRLWKELSY